MSGLRARSALVALLLCVMAALVGAPAASAEPPPTVQEQVTDAGGVLDTTTATADVQGLAQQTGYRLYAVYVDSFDGETGERWAQQTYQRSNLGGQDVVLAVATGDRLYGWWAGDGSGLSRGDLDGITPAVTQRLGSGDWTGSVTAATDGIASLAGGGGSAGGTGTTGQQPAPTTSSTSSTSSGGGWVLVVVLVVVGGVVALLATLAGRRRARRARAAGPDGEPAPPPEPLEDLARRAGAALVATDDAVDSSATEVGFATAEFGEEATEPYAQAVERARAELAAAFAAHRDATDATAEGGRDGGAQHDEGWLRQRYAEVVSRTAAADALLDQQAESFESLRAMTDKLPELLPRLERDVEATSARVPDAQRRVQQMTSRYAPSALTSVAGTDEHVAELLAYARDEHGDAEDARAAGTPGEAAVHVRTGRGAVTQAAAALDAVDALERDLAEAASSLAASRAETETDLAEAVDLVDRGVGGDRLGGAVARARSALGAADAAGDRDPMTAQRRIEEADVALDEALAGVREDRARSDRARAALASALPAARAEVEAARSYLRGRRGAVGSEARSRLDRARSLLADAEASAQNDPARALALAQQADAAAESAQDEASRDVGGFGGTGGYGGYGRRQRSSGSLGAAVLGGVIGSVLSSGSRGGGGWGGSSGGSFGGGGFGGGGFGGGGSFGGGGGGSFGGGGGVGGGGSF